MKHYDYDRMKITKMKILSIPEKQFRTYTYTYVLKRQFRGSSRSDKPLRFLYSIQRLGNRFSGITRHCIVFNVNKICSSFVIAEKRNR